MKNKENSLFSGGTLILFSLVVIVVLLVLFPGKKLLDSFGKNPVDSTSVQYLKELIANEPGDEALKIELVNKLIFLGKLDEAEIILSQLLTHSKQNNNAQLLTIEIQLRQYFNQTNDGAKKEKKLQIIKSINTLYPKLSDISSLDLLAQWSHEMAEPELAAKIYQQIGHIFDNKIDSDETMTHSFLWKLVGIKNTYAESIEKNEEYYAIKHLQALLSANLLDKAFNKAKDYVSKFNDSERMLVQAIEIATLAGKPYQSRDWGRHFLSKFRVDDEKIQQQITLELASDDPKNSLLWADKLLESDGKTNSSLLAYATNLASSLGNKEIFKKLSLKQLEESPNDPVLLKQLVQYELALSNLDSALQHASQRVSLDPDNVEARKQLAQVAQWNGVPYYAMQQLNWLYQKTNDEAFLKEAIQIGKGLYQYARVAKQYEILSHRRRLTESELKDWYVILKQTGFRDSGKRQFKQYVKKWPNDKQAWHYLASIEESTGNYNDAFQTLEKTEKNFGDASELSRKKIEMLIKANDYSEAWQQLSKSAKNRSREDTEFWKFYTQIAWLLGREKDAEKGYYHLLSHGNIEPGDFSRLLALNNEEEENERKLELLIIAWNKYKSANYLLDAIDLSEKINEPKQTDRLIIRADNYSHLFENNIRYWTIKAKVASQQKDRILTKKYLFKALKLDNQSEAIRVALLWHMIEYDSDSNLRKMIKNSLSISGNHSGLWEAIAAGYLRLGKPMRAIPWYARAVKEKPNDYLLLLSYAEALNEAGKRAKAKKIKHFVMTKVRPELVAKLSPIKPELAEFKRRYGHVVHETFGKNVTERWFKWVQSENAHVKQVLFDEYRITWLLAENRMEAARHYALKSLHKRIVLPTWQDMAIAVYDNNLDSIDRLLQNPDKLSSANQIVGLRTMGKEQDALTASRRNMNDSKKESELLTLRRQAADLGIRNPNGLAVSGKNYNISELDIWGASSEAAFTYDINSFWLNYQYLDFSSNSSNLFVSPSQEQENNITVKWRKRGLRNELWLQGNASIREDQDLYGIKAGVRYKIIEGWSANIDAAYNELSEDSAAYRLMGARDRVSLGLNGGLSKRDYFSLNLHGRNYKTRSGKHLGVGYGVDFSAGYRVKFAQPAIEINVHGILSESDLVTQLPVEMQTVVGSNRGVESVLSDSYKELGMNLKISDGEFRPFGYVEKSFHYYLNTGVFFTAPWTGTGISVEGGVGTRLFGHDDLSLIGRYVDSQGGVNTTATKSIELRYSFRFDEVFP